MYTFGPIAFLVGIVSSIVTFLIDVLTPVVGATSAPAVSVVVLTLLVRATLIPVGRSQVRAEFTRRRLAPKLTALRKRFKDEPKKLQEATMRLYRREGTTPLAGCLPALLQAPVFIAVYGLFLSPEVRGEPNHLLEAELGGVALGDRLHEVLGDPVAIALFGGLAVALVVIGWLHRRTMPPPPVEPDNPTAEMMAKVAQYLPFLVVGAVPFVPLAAVLYLVTTTAWTVAERVILRRMLQPEPA